MTTFFQLRNQLVEKTLTAAEKKKREEVAQAIERDQPGMDKAKKMAIATATAKRVAESGDFAKSVLAAAQKVSPSARMVTQDQKKKETEDEMKRRAAENKPNRPSSPTPEKYPLGGRDEKSGRSYSEEVELDEVTHQAKTTMKHIKNATPGEKAAAKDIKPGVAGYRDRVAMLHSAAARGGLKKEEADLDEASYAGKGNHRPGWMLRADPKLAAKFKEIEKRRQTVSKWAGKDLPKDKVKEEVDLDEGDHLAIRMGSGSPGYNKTPAGKARELKRRQEFLKGQMRFTKSQGGIAGPKGKLPEEVEPVSELNLFRKKETAEQKRARLTKEFEARKANRPENKPKQPNVWDEIRAPIKRGTNEEVEGLDEVSASLMGAVRSKREQQRHVARGNLETARHSGNKQATAAALKDWEKANTKVKKVEGRLTSYHVKKNAEEDMRNSRLGYDPKSHRSYNE